MKCRVRSYRSSRTAFARGLAALLSVMTVLQLRTASSAPADVFSMPAPVDGAAPRATEIKAGDATVSTQTGQLAWSYPIAVAPGRLGVAPGLSLVYSSQAPIYGGVASGFAWNLGVPEIREDTSESRLKTHSPLIELFQQEPQKDDRFVGLGGRRLRMVDEPKGADAYAAYRADGDDAYRRYERLNSGQPFWRVLSQDGAVMEFGGSTAACSTVSEGYAPLTRQLDAFGNSITYGYQEDEDGIAGECRLTTIEWGANANAGLANFARVELSWRTEWPGGPVGGTCNGVPVGSHSDYRSGTKIVSGASNLWKITATAFSPGMPGVAVHTREITLDYWVQYMQCNRSHAPLRLLKSIQESAWGTEAARVDLPPVTLEYGEPAVVFPPGQSGSRPWSALHPQFTANAMNLAWGYRYATESTQQIDRTPTIEEMMVDLDGDALPDRLVNTSREDVNGSCVAQWQRNEGPNAGSFEPRFGPVREITLPQLKWHGQNMLWVGPPPWPGGSHAEPERGEKCSLAGQVTAYWNSNVGQCHDGTPAGSPCQPASDLNDLTYYCNPHGRECPATQGDRAPFTYLHYRWVDADGDGLTDLVAAVHGDVRTYDIERGNYPYASPPPPEPELFGPWPACPSDVDRCKDVNPDCMMTPAGAPITDLSVINACIESAPSIPCNELIKSPDDQPQSINRGPYTRCEGLYPWFIFKNTGNGTFASPVIKYQPVPLESDLGDSNLAPATGWTSQQHAIVDFDGDGVLDAIAKPDPQWGHFWWVWFGDGTGGFERKRYMFFTRPGGLLSESGRVEPTSTNPSGTIGATEGLLDINADGILDHWRAGQNNASVWLNNGISHLSTTAITTPTTVKPGDVAHHLFGQNEFQCVAPHPNSEPSCIYWAGRTFQDNRIFDVDRDGRVDVIQDIGTEPRVFFNLGGQFSEAAVGFPSSNGQRNVVGVKRNTTSHGAPSVVEGTWELLSDHLDLDGDGIPEVIDFTGGYSRARQLNAAPPRLLTKVHNGRGAHMTITYASTNDKTAVTQAPSELWFDGSPKASSASQWVVKSLETSDDFSSTVSTTRYFYTHPRFGADDHGKYAFRGFEEVTTTSPSGAKSIDRFGYNVDWSGRKVETLLQPSDAESTVADEVRSITRVIWEERTLFGGALKTHHSTRTEQFTCWNGQTELECGVPAEAAAYSRTTTSFQPLVPAGGTEPLAWVATSALVQSGTVDADGDRVTTSTFILKSDPAFYRVAPLTTEKRVRNGGSLDLYGKVAMTWDPTYRVKLTEEVWFDEHDNKRSIVHHEYDLTTGNPKKRWKPKQWATNKFTEYIYDSRQLFVATEINELGHRTDHTYDYGTGTKLVVEGPNQRTCTTGPGCEPTLPLKEQHKVVVDGLGRVIQTWDTVSDDGSVYELWQRSTTSYVDIPAGAPTSTTHRARLSTTSNVWTQTKTELDGHGRPIRETTFAQGSAPADHVTVYSYRNDGTLATVQVPDPTQNNTARLTYTYMFDSLGRHTKMRRPDGADPLVDQSGVDVDYNGTQTRSVTVVPTAVGGGSVISTIAIRDAFGRVVEVEEVDPASPVPLRTTYKYGPDDNVSRIVDPEGVTTELKHDFAGQRTEITRHGRTWSYTYDKNGNLETQLVPGSSSLLTDPDYTTTIVYDDLDRPLSKVIGQRSLSAADRALFANRTETYEWDIGGNMIGHLRYWRSFAPNSNTAAIVHSTRFNNQGQPITTIQSLRIADFPVLERRFGQRFHLFGGVSETRFEDTLGGTNKTIATTAYDPRGLPTSMVLKRTGQPDQLLGVQTRNVAGLVTKRRTDTTGAMTFVESTWSYDKLGRVSSQFITKGPGPVPVTSQSLTYFADDNPRSLAGGLGLGREQLDFTFDSRHQLKSVSSVVTPGYFDSTYDYGPGGRFARATVSQTADPAPVGSAVVPRDVSYVYADADPERLTALTNVSDGSTYAAYTYDEPGNVTQRCYGGSGLPTCTGESIEYVYDGKDQLRRATKKVGGGVEGSEEYWYTGAGDRVAIVKRDAAGNKTELIWFIGDVQAHYDGAGSLTHIYSHLSLGTPVARVERTSNTATSVEYQFHGIANNTLAAVAHDGTINASFSYAPFGEIIEATSAGGAAGVAAHKRRLNDKYEDDLTGLAYYGARYYDKTSMSWTQADPLYRLVPDLAKLSTPRRANLYQFSLSNPLRYMDPDGRDAGYWTRGSQDVLDDAMRKESLGATYGAGSINSWGKIDTNSCSHNSNRCSFILQQDNSAAWAAAAASAAPGQSAVYIPPPRFNGELFGPVFDRFQNIDLERGTIELHEATRTEEIICGVVTAWALAEIAGLYMLRTIVAEEATVVAGVAAGAGTTAEVTRWGRPGLESGDWVMKGGRNLWNYFWSGKWQPSWIPGGNKPAARATGETFQVAKEAVRFPIAEGGKLNPANWIKFALGQRQYLPPGE